MTVGLIEGIRLGGCYWKRERSSSPGHSILVSNETAFKVAVEGPGSNIFVSGKCLHGYWVPDTGQHSGRKFASANVLVNKIREPSSNAFLYVHLFVGGEWVSADTLRRSTQSELDPAEELALEWALRDVDDEPGMDPAQKARAAADLVAADPERIERATMLLNTKLEDL
jgi:hypothetical protein